MTARSQTGKVESCTSVLHRESCSREDSSAIMVSDLEMEKSSLVYLSISKCVKVRNPPGLAKEQGLCCVWVGFEVVCGGLSKGIRLFQMRYRSLPFQPHYYSWQLTIGKKYQVISHLWLLAKPTQWRKWLNFKVQELSLS